MSKGEYDSRSLKQRQGSHTISLKKPRGIFDVPARDCWHEGIWLCFRVKKSDGTYVGHKVPPWRVVGVSWTEQPEEQPTAPPDSGADIKKRKD